MGAKDKTEKVLEDYNDVFADIFNRLLFREEFLKKEMLEFGPTESIYKSETGDLKDQRRDVLKYYLGSGLLLSSYGIENQSEVERFMPVRVLGYDYATYRNCLTNKKLLAPVITIVLNFSDKRWSEPVSLCELMEIPDKMRPFVQDYRIKVFDIAYLEDEVIESFTSDFKIVAKFFKAKRLGYSKKVMVHCFPIYFQ